MRFLNTILVLAAGAALGAGAFVMSGVMHQQRVGAIVLQARPDLLAELLDRTADHAMPRRT